MTDILTKDNIFIHLTPFICSRTSTGALIYPTPKKIKIEENPKLFAIYAILEILIQTIKDCVYDLMQKE